jgi:hypothetical protein
MPADLWEVGPAHCVVGVVHILFVRDAFDRENSASSDKNTFRSALRPRATGFGSSYYPKSAVYRIVEEVAELGGGSVTSRLVRKFKDSII